MKIININSDKGHDILKKCRVLREYSLFVDTVRKYDKEEDSLKKAINECIASGILADYLKRKGSEVTNMLIAEYDYEEDIRANREEAREEAIEEVWDAAQKEVEAAKEDAQAAKEEIEKYSRLILRLTGEGKNDMIIRIAEDNVLRERLYQEYHL